MKDTKLWQKILNQQKINLLKFKYIEYEYYSQLTACYLRTMPMFVLHSLSTMHRAPVYWILHVSWGCKHVQPFLAQVTV